jgi:polysaccharide export outer membrane protein
MVEGDSVFNDTVVVRAGPTLRVLSLPEDSLRGVLRAELQPHVTAWITRYYKNAIVRATPLIQLGVLGEVARPGYYRLPADITLSDALMSAGGPTPRADMPRTVVRRRARQLLGKPAVRDAMAGGATLDQLGMNPGDEIVVSAKKERNWMTAIQFASLVTGVVLSVRASRGF